MNAPSTAIESIEQARAAVRQLGDALLAGKAERIADSCETLRAATCGLRRLPPAPLASPLRRRLPELLEEIDLVLAQLAAFQATCAGLIAVTSGAYSADGELAPPLIPRPAVEG